jgi:toxin ParE1/3/4
MFITSSRENSPYKNELENRTAQPQRQAQQDNQSHWVPARRWITAHRPLNSWTPALGRRFSKTIEDLTVASDEISIAVEPFASSFFVEAAHLDQIQTKEIDMAKFRLADAARRDLEGIWDYIAEDNPSAADSFVAMLIEKCQLLAKEPEIGRDRPEIKAGLKTVIFYRVTDSIVEIARALSGYRDITQLFH